MLVGDSPAFRRFWYVAMPAAKLDQGPQPFSLFGEEMVIWKAADGTVSALRDECCHRAAKLSLGEVIGDSIQSAPITAGSSARMAAARRSRSAPA